MTDELDPIPFSILAYVNPAGRSTSLRPDSLVSFIPMQDVSEDGEWTGGQTRRFDEVKAGYTPFAERDVLFAKITPCMENGKGAQARGLVNGVGFGSTEFHVLRARVGVSDRFVYHWCQAPALRLKAQAFMIGSAGQQRVQPEFFDKFCVPLLPVPEQCRVSVILDALNHTIRQTDQVIAKLRQMKQGLLQDLLTWGIDSRGQLRDPIRHPGSFMDSPQGPIPTEWKVATVGELFRRRVEPGLPGLPVMAVTMKAGLVNRDLVDRRVESTLTPGQHLLVRRGDIVYNMMRMWQGVLGRATHDCLVSPAYVVLGPRKGIDTAFAEYLFSSPNAIAKFTRFSQGIVNDRLRLYFRDLVRISFAVPRSMEEQASIAERLHSTDAFISTMTDEVDKLRRIRLGLTNDLLTGDVRVSPRAEQHE